MTTSDADDRRRHVLVVEDEPRMGRLLGDMLVELGYAASVVGSAEAGLRSMAEHRHPIVVMDLNLPGMSGMDAIEKIRQRWPETAAIVLTGFGDLESAKRAIHLDVVEFLTKPAHLGDLETALARAERRLRDADLQALADRIDDDDNDPSRIAGRAHDDEAAAPRRAGEADPSVDPPTDLRSLERQAILDALDRHDGNRQRAADALGISVRTLYYRLKEYRIYPD